MLLKNDLLMMPNQIDYDSGVRLCEYTPQKVLFKRTRGYLGYRKSGALLVSTRKCTNEL